MGMKRPVTSGEAIRPPPSSRRDTSFANTCAASAQNDIRVPLHEVNTNVSSSVLGKRAASCDRSIKLTKRSRTSSDPSTTCDGPPRRSLRAKRPSVRIGAPRSTCGLDENAVVTRKMRAKVRVTMAAAEADVCSAHLESSQNEEYFYSNINDILRFTASALHDAPPADAHPASMHFKNAWVRRYLASCTTR